MTPSEAFFTVHRDLPREGPGLPEDVLWALDVAGTPATARILDAACGPGADTATFAEARPSAVIDGVDLQAHFVKAARERCQAFGSRVSFAQQDYASLSTSYDLIWCAGAAYFRGFEALFKAWEPSLRPGGRVAFSEPAWVGESASPEAQTFWSGEGTVDAVPSLHQRLDDAGWRVLGQRWLIGAPWEAYYTPMKARLARLRRSAPDDALLAAIAEAEEEIANWEAAPDQIAYVLFVVAPK